MTTSNQASETAGANTVSSSIYNVNPPPKDHIRTISQSDNPPETPSSPSYGLDSLAGLLMSSIASPLYLYATLRGKSTVWDDILADTFSSPSALPCLHPVLDVGCGRGLVLLKLAQHQKQQHEQQQQQGSTSSQTTTDCAFAYGIDIFNAADQTGNSPLATYANAAALGVLDHTVLHTASFTETFPFADDVFAVVTSSLAIHNASQKEERKHAVREMARVCRRGGRIVVVDLYGYFGPYETLLREELGWTDVTVSMVGWRMMFGILPCQMLVATKPSESTAAS